MSMCSACVELMSMSAVRLTGLDARLDRTGAMPEQQSAAHPFIKPKWDERAYFLVQDSIWEAMDDGCAADMHRVVVDHLE